MSKKYLSVEEAAQMLGLTTSEVLRAREQDKIRGFADRGTWKFKAEDIENYQREIGSGAAASDVLSDDDVLSEQPTVIRKGEPSSDSDVRLIYSGTPGGSDAPLVPDSDSDVRLAGTNKSALAESDSDVKLVQGDKSVSDDRSVSDVRLTPLDSGEIAAMGSKFGSASSDSDSDVKLVGRASSQEVPIAKPADSGKMRIAKPKSSNKLKSGTSAAGGNPADDTIDFTPDEGSVLDDSGIDSGISLVGDSGISLESPQDSGISLEKGDSGISLSSDSGMNLAHDSGISLDITSDSGISLSESAEETKARKPAKKGPQTMPMLDIPLAGESASDTNMEVPLLDDDDSKDSSYDLADSHDSTSVITLDEDSSEEFEPTVTKRPRPASSSDALEEAVFDDEGSEVEVADEVGEDDELEEMDAFGAADEDFDDFQTGESHAELEVAAPRAVAQEQEWGTGVFATLCVTSLLMLVCGTVAFDLLQGLWHADVENRNPLGGIVLGLLAPMFGG